jgi:hypothetical protein
MDEESIGLLGVLLIVTGLVLSHQMQTSRAVPMLHDVHWPQVVDVLGCSDPSDRTCAVVMAR